ncbi:hypothetical protein EG240_11130 [Paenimyroides tangerinum]|uniref:CarboxypepD_reg-like domain-containing protein n=1 Tax=Paenimyroides tangerinum TaxID=2488728 RepID=A0A3P3W3X2_9FLAO|nr:hypothetical protein [Paenimyroides tangerinum]RRJ89660.1 hypothetical protein EG240_11130 [Paenimyroides tangerinum]
MKPILFFLFLSVSALAQQTFYLKDKATENPIAYASIYNDKGTFKINSESDGSFVIPEEFKKETFIIESIGYETIETNLENTVIFLEDKAETLEEIIIIPRLGTKEIKIGNVNNENVISGYIGKYSEPYLIAKQINLDKNTEICFLKKLSILTTSYKDNVNFKIKIFDSKDGKPNQLINDEDIIVETGKANKIGKGRKSYSISSIQLEEYNIKVPSEGFFIAVEWIINDHNLKENGCFPLIWREESKNNNGIFEFNYKRSQWEILDNSINKDLLFEVILTN